MLVVAGIAAVLGYLLTTVLPEPAGRTLEEVSGEDTGPVVLPDMDSVLTSPIPTVDLISAGDPAPVPQE